MIKEALNEIKVENQKHIENDESSSDSQSHGSDEIEEDEVYQIKKNKELGKNSFKMVSYEYVVTCEKTELSNY